MYGFRHFYKKQKSDHIALDGVSFDINKGERVAIIGRNGAGKSTLLKILSGVSIPTSGHVELHVKAHVLLQIGAGFNMDMTGRQNVEQYLRLLGVAKNEIDKTIEQVEDFAEIGDYFDQPLNTYSTGMQARIMFSAAVSTKPDLLIIDEILSVGDAYFSQKCLHRIMELCDQDNVTLLLVTHNIYDAQKMCERMIWIENGRLMRDSDSISVMNAYEASIREQAKKANLATESEKINIMGEVKRTDDNKKPGKLYISGIELESNSGELLRLKTGVITEKSDIKLYDSKSEGSWGEPVSIDGMICREYLRFGSIFPSLPFSLKGNAAKLIEEKELKLIKITCNCSEGQMLEFCLRDHESEEIYEARSLVEGKPGWQEVAFELEKVTHLNHGDDGSRFGTRILEIEGLSFMNSDYEKIERIGIGNKLIMRLNFIINKENFSEKPLILFSIVKDGLNIAYIWSDSILIEGKPGDINHIDITCDPLLFGRGKYNFTVSIYRDGFMDEKIERKYFAVDDAIYDMHRRAYDLEVVAKDADLNMLYDFTYQQPSEWRMKDGKVVSGGFVINEDY